MRTFLALTFGISVGVMAAVVLAAREVQSSPGGSQAPQHPDPAPTPLPTPASTQGGSQAGTPAPAEGGER